MMYNKVKLDLNKSVTRLAGYEYGKKIFEEQVKGKIDYNSPFVLVFPDHITNLASSFVQGFFGELIETIGIAGIERQVEIETCNAKVRDSIMKNLL